MRSFFLIIRVVSIPRRLAKKVDRVLQELRSVRIRRQSARCDTSPQASSIHETGEGSPVDNQLY
jgi:hypothetical protein